MTNEQTDEAPDPRFPYFEAREVRGVRSSTWAPRSIWASPVWTVSLVTLLIGGAFLAIFVGAIMIFPWFGEGPANAEHERQWRMVKIASAAIPTVIFIYGLRRAVSSNTLSSVILIGALTFMTAIFIAPLFV